MKQSLPLLGAATILLIIFGTIYATVQQDQRRAANYPQIQLASTAAESLNQGVKPAQLMTPAVDLNASLAPFLIIYDKSGHVVAGSGYLSRQLAAAPLGILTAAQSQAYHAVTWQPQAGVRIAAVTVSAKDYYVLSGRSLREVEANEAASLHLAITGGLASLAVLGVVSWLVRKAQ
ncbi:MAG: hypothetical protein ABI602_00970 [Candidatus Saccharibacteria bacterium]